jgi:hypothetical protein
VLDSDLAIPFAHRENKSTRNYHAIIQRNTHSEFFGNNFRHRNQAIGGFVLSEIPPVRNPEEV